MLRTAHWTVEVFLDEDDEGTAYAEAFLLSGDDEPLFARGSAHSAPAEQEGPEGGALLVAARALSELAQVLVDAAKPATLDRG
jgi:Rv2632c-like